MSATITPSRLLMGFMDYYSYYFNVSMFGIDVSNEGSFYELSSPESAFVILFNESLRLLIERCVMI